MAAGQPSGITRKILAALCILGGIGLSGVALDILSVDPDSVLAPRWVLGFVGVIFILAGAMLIAGMQSRINDLFAAIMLLLFGAIALWISLIGYQQGISGGVPGLSDTANTSIGRLVFGFGGLLCLGMSVYAVRRFARLK